MENCKNNFPTVRFLRDPPPYFNVQHFAWLKLGWGRRVRYCRCYRNLTTENSLPDKREFSRSIWTVSLSSPPFFLRGIKFQPRLTGCRAGNCFKKIFTFPPFRSIRFIIDSLREERSYQGFCYEAIELQPPPRPKRRKRIQELSRTVTRSVH